MRFKKNKKFVVTAITIIAVIFLLISGLGFNLIDISGSFFNGERKAEKDQNFPDKQIKIGFCPTMQNYAEKISSSNENIEPVLFTSAAEALNSLEAGFIDAAIIGRIAKDHEIGLDTRELRIREGHTLISNQKQIIHYSELEKVNIHTAIPKEITVDIFPNQANIYYYSTTHEAIEKGINEAVLINWDDYMNEFELFIPVYDDGRKLESFRSPVIYHKLDETYIGLFEKALE